MWCLILCDSGAFNKTSTNDCTQCHAPYVSAMASSIPLFVYSSRCETRHYGTSTECSACNRGLHSKLETIQHEVSDTTSVVACDLGLQINVRCPGCLTVCQVPSSACFRCGTCNVYFAAPSIGAVTSFHLTRLTRSLSQSITKIIPNKTSLTVSLANYFKDDDSSSDEEFGPVYDDEDDVSSYIPAKPLTLEEDIPLGIEIAEPKPQPTITDNKPVPLAVPVNVETPMPALRKTMSAPTTYPYSSSFEKDWDILNAHDGVLTDSDDEEEEKEELSDEMMLEALQRVYYVPKQQSTFECKPLPKVKSVGHMTPVVLIEPQHNPHQLNKAMSTHQMHPMPFDIQGDVVNF
ncbi:hypothetical protein THRCLA_05522 [Thraustotheca clavata]|uniref:Uncharacterized protein n=1 Tax=Thraustotheca clavata TaxID=74557 RepID=A0A1V9ZVT3_9STRA|nr:hypothetical protein THRCLA_05522 [Thraustotheca clavata]